MERFLLQDHIVVRQDEDASQVDDEGAPGLVLGGLALRALAQFRVGSRLCTVGIADSTTACPVDPAAGSQTDLRGRGSTSVTLSGAPFDLWHLPEWAVETGTVVHLVLVPRSDHTISRDSHRQLLTRLRVEHDGVQVLPVSMGTYGGGGLLQCTAEFRGRMTAVRAFVD